MYMYMCMCATVSSLKLLLTSLKLKAVKSSDMPVITLTPIHVPLTDVLCFKNDCIFHDPMTWHEVTRCVLQFFLFVYEALERLHDITLGKHMLQQSAQTSLC